MSLSKYGSTEETTNLARLARIILGPCTDVLREVLMKHMTPSALSHNVKTCIANLPKFRKSPFTKEQETTVYTEQYSFFDITLLYTLFRNIFKFPPFSKQWGNVPNPGDRSISANIERIRLLRNKYQGHYSSISISSSDFNQEWQDIVDIVKELEMYLGTSTAYQEEVKNITSYCMDPKQETKYIEQLLDLNKKIDDISANIENTCGCKKRKELFDREVSRWKEDDKVFLETHNFPAMFNKVVNQSYMTFVGAPGSGKSVTARHIALKLQEEGYDILPIKDISDIETHCNPEISQVFVIDDVVGVFGLDMSEFNKLCRYESTIKKPEMKETKVLMTCREVVYRNEYLKNTFLSEKENVVQLNSDENSLTDQDKYNLLVMYSLDKNFLSSIDLSSTSNMFPFLCKLFSSTGDFKNYGPSFFMSPYPCILDEMDKIKIRNKLQYASLVLLMINDSKLSKTIFDDDFSSNKTSMFQEKKFSVLERCKVERQTNSFSFIDALSEMEGTYTKKCDSEFTFIHDSMFEIMACHFGRQFPELMMNYMSSDYIAHYIKVDRNKSENRISENEESKECKTSSLCINLSESNYQMLAERLFRDVENGEMFVFENEALKHPSVLQAYIEVMARKSYRELYSIFLSELKTGNEFFRSFVKSIQKQTKTFLRFADILFNSINHVRAICWVIYNGHNQILQYIIDQILTENGNVSDLFSYSYNKDGKEKVAYDIVDDERGSFMTSSDSDIESDIETHSEKVIDEQFRLLCLGCYSADETTVKTLLKHIDINIIGTFTQFTSCKVHSPLTAACLGGNLNVVEEMIKAGAEINLKDGRKTPLIIACGKGHLSLVQKLIKAGADVNLGDGNDTPLTAACDYGDLNVVEELMKAGADINLKGGDQTPLFIACCDGNLLLVQILLKAGADVNLGDGTDTPLTAACGYGILNVDEELIKEEVDVNIRYETQTLLTAACYGGHLSVVETLIKAGADVNLTGKNGQYTPLIAACENNDLKTINVLIRAGVDVNLVGEIVEYTPLITACVVGDLDVVNVLIHAGADVNLRSNDRDCTPLIAACMNNHLNLVDVLIKAGADVNRTGRKHSPLSAACQGGHLKVVDTLLKCGADVNLAGETGEYTPLLAVSQGGHLEVFDLLIKAGADVNIKDGNITPLIAACKENHMRVVETLIDAGSDVNFQTFDKTALVVACNEGHLNVVETLIKAAADVNLTGKNGQYTPLIAACENNDLKTINVLIRAGADVNLIGECGEYSPLITACVAGYLDVVNVLIHAGSDVNLRSNDRDHTPLIAACINNHLNLVDVLIKAGADVNRTGKKHSPLSAACQGGHLKVVDTLLSCGADVNLAGETGEYTPLLVASQGGHLEVFDLLIEAGANLSLFG